MFLEGGTPDVVVSMPTVPENHGTDTTSEAGERSAETTPIRKKRPGENRNPPKPVGLINSDTIDKVSWSPPPPPWSTSGFEDPPDFHLLHLSPPRLVLLTTQLEEATSYTRKN